MNTIQSQQGTSSASLADLTKPATSVARNEPLGQDAFLQLMVAQLRYQDPTSPADSQSFIAQTAQFTSVETLKKIDDKMTAMSRNDDLTTIGSLVGSTVQFADSTGGLINAPVTSGRTTETGIVLTLPDREISIDDIVAIVDPNSSQTT